MKDKCRETHNGRRSFFVGVATGKLLPPKKESGGKIPAVLGSGVMATRHTLDVKFGVQVPTPQLEKA